MPMPKIKTKDAYLKSIKRVNRSIRRVSNVGTSNTSAENAPASDNLTPEEYASTVVEAYARKGIYFAGQSAKTLGRKTRLAARKKSATKDTKKATRRSVQVKRLAQAAFKKAVQISRITAKAVVKAAKAAAIAAKAFIAFLIEGGWIVVVVILAICLILFIMSAFCIALSSDMGMK